MILLWDLFSAGSRHFRNKVWEKTSIRGLKFVGDVRPKKATSDCLVGEGMESLTKSGFGLIWLSQFGRRIRQDPAAF